MFNLDSNIILKRHKLLEEFKGLYTEKFVANVLNYLYNESPNYYFFNRNDIDSVIKRKNEIIPIEAKSNISTNHNN